LDAADSDLVGGAEANDLCGDDRHVLAVRAFGDE
jgi:hypothetical protein